MKPSFSRLLKCLRIAISVISKISASSATVCSPLLSTTAQFHLSSYVLPHASPFSLTYNIRPQKAFPGDLISIIILVQMQIQVLIPSLNNCEYLLGISLPLQYVFESSYIIHHDSFEYNLA